MALLLSLWLVSNNGYPISEPSDNAVSGSFYHHEGPHSKNHYLTQEPEITWANSESAEDLAKQVFQQVKIYHYKSPRRVIRLIEEHQRQIKNTQPTLYANLQKIKFSLLLKVGDLEGAIATFESFNQYIQPFLHVTNDQIESEYVIWSAIMKTQLDLYQYQFTDFSRIISSSFYNIKSPELKLWFLYTLGINQLRLYEFDNGLNNLLEALRLAEQLEQFNFILDIQDQLARVFFYTEQFERALEKSSQMLALSLELNDRFAEVNALTNQMNIYYMQAVRKVQKAGSGEQTQENLPSEYFQLLEKANQLEQKVREKSESIGAHRARTRAMIIQQNISLSLEKFEEVIAIADETINYSTHHQLGYERAVSFNNKSIALRGLGNFDESLLALREAENFYQQTRQLQSLVWTLEDYANLYQAKGDYKLALDFYKQYHLAARELSENSNANTIFDLQEKYSAQQKADEIAKLNQQALLSNEQLRTERLGRWLLVVVLIAVSCISWILYNKRRKLRALLRKQSELNNEIQELSAAKQRFFINISHEFRTALTLAIGSLNWLKRLGVNNKEQQSAVDNALSNNMHMLGLINEVLDIERMQTDSPFVNPIAFPVKKSLEQCILRFSEQCKKKQLNIALTGISSTCFIKYDYSHFEKIISNLISNAIKYAPNQSEIEISLSQTEQYWKLSVRDYGDGVDPRDLPLLCRRFYQGRNSTMQSTPGTGIGLSIVKELIDLNQSIFNIDNHKDGGCIVTIFIPINNLIQDNFTNLSEASKRADFENVGVNINFNDELIPNDLESQENSLAINDMETNDQHETKPSILLVDDNPEIRELIRRILQADYNVIEAENGKQAIKIAQSIQPDLILSDVLMPVMDGFELTKVLRSDPNLAHISIILLTALGDKPHTINGLNKGADDYIAKPYDELELQTRISGLLKRKKELSKSLWYQFKSQSIPAVSFSIPESNSDKRIKKLEAVIADNISSWEFDVEQMYTALNMTRSTLFRYTKQVYGCSPKNLLKERRLEMAYAMLTKSTCSVSEVAYAVGFQSLSTFSRAFREKYNSPPTKIQATIKEHKKEFA